MKNPKLVFVFVLSLLIAPAGVFARPGSADSDLAAGAVGGDHERNGSITKTKKLIDGKDYSCRGGKIDRRRELIKFKSSFCWIDEPDSYRKKAWELGFISDKVARGIEKEDEVPEGKLWISPENKLPADLALYHIAYYSLLPDVKNLEIMIPLSDSLDAPVSVRDAMKIRGMFLYVANRYAFALERCKRERKKYDCPGKRKAIIRERDKYIKKYRRPPRRHSAPPTVR